MSKLAELENELVIATQEHKIASAQQSAANSLVCDTTNRVNRAQQAIEKEIAQLRENAPYQTDWAQKKNRGRSNG